MLALLLFWARVSAALARAEGEGAGLRVVYGAGVGSVVLKLGSFLSAYALHSRSGRGVDAALVTALFDMNNAAFVLGWVASGLALLGFAAVALQHAVLPCWSAYTAAVSEPASRNGRLLFTTLSMIAEFESDLARARTREGMAVARAKGRLRGKQPKLSPRQEVHLVELYRAGHTIGELEELFPVTRSTIYRADASGNAGLEAEVVMDELLVAVNPDPWLKARLSDEAAAQRRDGLPHLRHVAEGQSPVLLPSRHRRESHARSGTSMVR